MELWNAIKKQMDDRGCGCGYSDCRRYRASETMLKPVQCVGELCESGAVVHCVFLSQSTGAWCTGMPASTSSRFTPTCVEKLACYASSPA